jgi:hypothetical protein
MQQLLVSVYLLLQKSKSQIQSFENQLQYNSNFILFRISFTRSSCYFLTVKTRHNILDTSSPYPIKSPNAK